MKENILTNMKIMLKRKSFWYVLTFMLIIAIGMYAMNVLKYKGYNIDNAPDACASYYLDYGNAYAPYILFLFPILLVMPYADIHMKDCVNGTNLLYLTRSKRREWYFAQALVVMIGTFIVFLIPSLLNILLNAITFAENGNYVQTGDYQYSYNYFWGLEGNNIMRDVLEKGAKLGSIICNSPQLYNVMYAFLIAGTGAVLAYFAYAISMILGKGKIYIYLLVFVIVQFISLFDVVAYTYMPVYVCCNFSEYLLSGFRKVGCSYSLFFGMLAVLCIISTILIGAKAKKSEL